MPDVEVDGTGDAAAEAAAAQSVIEGDSQSDDTSEFQGYVETEGDDGPAPPPRRQAREEEAEPAAPQRPSRRQQKADEQQAAERQAAREANLRFQERQERRNGAMRARDQEMAALQDRYDRSNKLSNALLQMLERERAERAQPQDDGTDPELRTALDRSRQQLREEISEELRPVKEQLEQDQQVRQHQADLAQRQEQQRQAFTEFAQEVNQAETEYRATPRGQGYDQRVHDYKGLVAGALGELAELAPHVPELRNPQFIQALVHEDIKGIAVMAMALKLSPAVLMDTIARAFLGGKPVAAPRQRVQASPEIEAARRAVEQGATRSSRGSAPPRGRRNNLPTAEDVLESGLSNEDLEKFASSGRYADLIGRLAQDAEEIAEEF